MSIIYTPFSWLLLTLYNLFNNYGVAVLCFAVIIKLILLPFQMKSKRSSMRMTRFTPRLKELEKKYEGNKAKYQEEVSKIYKEEKINPMSGCLWSLIPFPIMIGLYTVMRQPLTMLMKLTGDQIDLVTETLMQLGVYTPATGTAGSYSQVALANLIHNNYDAVKAVVPEVMNIDFSFLGLNLGETPSWRFFLDTDWSDPSIWLPALGLFLIPIVSGLLSYFSMKISNATTPQTEQQQSSMKGMMLTMPLISVWIGFVAPAALGIYWAAQSALSMIQDYILSKHYNKILDAEDAERLEREAAKEAELERKRQETERLRAEGSTTRNASTSKKKIQAGQKTREAERKAAEKAARRAQLGLDKDQPESQVGNRRYARGRAYVDDRFTDPDNAETATLAAAAESDEYEAIVSELSAQEAAEAISDVIETDAADDADEPGYDDVESDSDDGVEDYEDEDETGDEDPDDSEAE